MLQYFDPNLRPPALVCGTLLAGITIDTKHFAFNVGSRTFEAAGYLRKNGADTSIVKQMFQDDMERNFGDVATRGSSHGRGCARKCRRGDQKRRSSPQNRRTNSLASAASRQHSSSVATAAASASAALSSNINVQIICERLGGGGHLTMAGAQMADYGVRRGGGAGAHRN